MHSLTILLNLVGNVSSVVVSLDLKWAIELGSALAILMNFIWKEFKGKLLAWLWDYSHSWSASFRFLGCHSENQPLENGRPQSGVLSLVLFSALIEFSTYNS